MVEQISLMKARNQLPNLFDVVNMVRMLLNRNCLFSLLDRQNMVSVGIYNIEGPFAFKLYWHLSAFYFSCCFGKILSSPIMSKTI